MKCAGAEEWSCKTHCSEECHLSRQKQGASAVCEQFALADSSVTPGVMLCAVGFVVTPLLCRF